MPTLLTIREIPEGRVLEEDERGRLKATRLFRLQFDSINVGESFALYASGLPRRWDSYEGPDEYCFGLRCVRRRVTQDTQDHFFWNATIEYDTFSADPAQVSAQSGEGGSGTPLDENPLHQPPKIVLGAIHDSKVLEKSVLVGATAAKAILNSANQPFQPRPTVDSHRGSLTYTRNEDSPELHEGYWDTVNSNVFAGYSARELKLNYVTANNDYRNGVMFWVKTYYFEARFPDWDLHILDRGTKVLNSDNVAVPIIKKGVTGEELLDGSGNLLITGGAGPIPAPITLDFYAYSEADFHDLGLPGL